MNKAREINKHKLLVNEKKKPQKIKITKKEFSSTAAL
jgi:hypothetical protein